MKWFWYSLIGFCVLMCSCKTQKSAHDINFVSKENMQAEIFKYEALTGSSRLHKIEIDKSKLKITETIFTRKYDKDTGAVTEETETEREITQNSDKVSTEEGNQAVTECNQLKAEHLRDTTEMMESEVEEESIGGQESFGKWFGIVFGLVTSLLFVYLLRKFRVN